MEKQLSLDQINLLGNPQRRAILRRLMAGSATLSQLGQQLNESPAHIRHHVKALEEAGLVEHDPQHPRQNHLEKYYRSTAQALWISLAVLPEPPDGRPVIVLGSKDQGTQVLADSFNRKGLGVSLQVLPLNSMDGLVALRQGVCRMSTSHLLDAASGEYNRPFVRHLFPGQPMSILRLYLREEGLIVRPGNPLGIQGLEDLLRPGVRLVNRELGSGIRVWLDKQLQELGLDPAVINGYQDCTDSHAAVARAVLQGRADAGLGIAAWARELGLDFIPLFQEPYELVLPADLLKDRQYAPLYEHLTSAEFRQDMAKLNGYSVPFESGRIDTLS